MTAGRTLKRARNPMLAAGDAELTLAHNLCRVDAYLRDRAVVVGIVHEGSTAALAGLHMCGVRCFTGVEIRENGWMLRDTLEPFPGYFARWMKEQAS